MANLGVVEPEATCPIAGLVDNLLADRRVEGRSPQTVGWCQGTLRWEHLSCCAGPGRTDPSHATPHRLGAARPESWAREGAQAAILGRTTGR